MKELVVNGLFMTNTLSGAQRNAYELLFELDKIIEKKQIEILVPLSFNGKENIFKNISVVKYGKFHDRLWEQFDLLVYSMKNKKTVLNLCNTAPLFNPGVVMLLDVIFKNRNCFPQEAQAFKKYVSRDIQTWMICLFSKHILTISDFSKNEIMKFFKVKPSNISVIPCAWDHYKRIPVDETILDMYDLKKESYYFAISNIAKHKNFTWILELAKRTPNRKFVVAGAVSNRHFDDDFCDNNLPNVIYVGRISDEKAKALMCNCKAFLSPGFYEGFGIPPMEALSVGRRIIISDIPVYREIYGEEACYINPYKYEYELETILSQPKNSQKEVLTKYKWSKSAQLLKESLSLCVHSESKINT